MNLKISLPPIEISNDEGFSKNDIFDQKGFAEKLSKLVENNSDELVIGLDSRWGEGKSTFVKMWKGMLQNEKNIKCIYFDAFENDYINDPFLALVGELYSLIDDASPYKKAKENFKESAISALKIVGKASVGITAKTLTAGVLDANDIFDEGTDKDIAKVSSKLLDDYLSKKMSDIKKDKNNLSDFRKALNTLPEVLGSNEKIVIVIDELDRCKPTFSLELLEKIKHVFSVKNIVFVLVMNRLQIENIIKNTYGESTDANEYLQKFIGLWINFSNDDQNSESRVLYLNNCLRRIDPEGNTLALNHARILLSDLVRHYGLSLREIEKVVIYFSLYINIVGNNIGRDYQLIPVFLCVLRVTYPKIYTRLSDGNISYSELIENTNLSNLIEFDSFEGPLSIQPLLDHLKSDLSSIEEVRRILGKPEYINGGKVPNNRNIITDTCKWFSSFSYK